MVSHRRVHSVYGCVRHVNKGRILRLCTEQNRQPIDPNGTNAGLTAVPHQAQLKPQPGWQKINTKST